MNTIIISSFRTKIVALALGLFFVLSAQAQGLPRVKILATGGTIAGAGAAADQAGYKAGALPIDQLLSAVWNYDFAGDTRIVDVHISHLREKVEVDTKKPAYIKTIRGLGYKLEEPKGE